MNYRDDWYKSKERFNAFWKNEIIDRCCVSIFAPKKNAKHFSDTISRSYEQKLSDWLDAEAWLKKYKSSFENTYFCGEATPTVILDFGVSGHAGFFKNSSYKFDETVWFFPSINDWGKDILEFDPDSLLYRKTVEVAKYLVDEGKGSFLVSMPDTVGNADALAHLRGSENLLMDMIDDEEHVVNALKKIQEAWLKINEEIYSIVRNNNDGGSSVGWLNTWAPGKHAQLQCDLSVMISPRDFEKFIIPEINEQIAWMDYSLYHFDGIEQLKHLDMLLSIDDLDVIQWTHVAGQQSPLAYIPELKKIQQAGKGLVVYVEPSEFEGLVEQLSSKGLYVLTYASSEDEANEIMKRVEKLTHE